MRKPALSNSLLDVCITLPPENSDGSLSKFSNRRKLTSWRAYALNLSKRLCTFELLLIFKNKHSGIVDLAKPRAGNAAQPAN